MKSKQKVIRNSEVKKNYTHILISIIEYKINPKLTIFLSPFPYSP